MKAIIIGGGQAGAYIAGLLMKNNYSVMVIENRPSAFSKLENDLPKESICYGSGTDPDVLEKCGIAEADVVAAVTGADETNLVASTIAKFEFGVPRVIARVNNPKNAWMFDAGMGVDAAVNQADLVAHLVVEEIDMKNVFQLMKINRGSYSIIQLNVSAQSAAVNKQLHELGLPKNAILIAIYRGKEVIIPHGQTAVQAGDGILALADKNGQMKINELFSV